MFLVPKVNGWNCNPLGAVDYSNVDGCIKMDAIDNDLDRSCMAYPLSDCFSLY